MYTSVVIVVNAMLVADGGTIMTSLNQRTMHRISMVAVAFCSSDCQRINVPSNEMQVKLWSVVLMVVPAAKETIADSTALLPPR